jgi:hypothetical protein
MVHRTRLSQLREASCEAPPVVVVVVVPTVSPQPDSARVLRFGLLCAAAASHATVSTGLSHHMRQRCCRHGVQERCLAVNCKHSWHAKFSIPKDNTL